MSINSGGGPASGPHGPLPFLIPPPPGPQLGLVQRPVALVIKSEPLDPAESHSLDENVSPSSHEEILNSEFGQSVRETAAPSGRTVLGKNSRSCMRVCVLGLDSATSFYS